MINNPPLAITVDDALIQYCVKWSVVKLELFGSMVRGDATPDSDIDLLVTFAPESHWTLMDLVSMEWELGDLLGRKADLVVRGSVEESSNFIRRREILGTAKLLYAAA